MKFRGKVLFQILSVVVMMLVVTSNAFAATGFQGYAVYRDGVVGNFNWHAAIMDQPYSTATKPVVQAVGFNYNVQTDTWSGFMAGKVYKGVYKPKATVTSSTRDLFVGMGRKLVGEYIPYNLSHQVYYDASACGTWVDPSEISSMRCDGVVEYIYEWYGYKVYGSTTLWDVSKAGITNRDHHGGLLISPKTQPGYLTLVQTGLPK